MPKAYGPEDLADPVPDVLHTSHSEGIEVLGRPVTFGLGEFIASLSAIYLISMACFNAGYFYHVDGQFVDLFSFSDLIGANIPILQYFILVYAFYSFAGALLVLVTRGEISWKDRIEQAFLDSYCWNNQRSLLWSIGLISCCIVMGLIDRKLPFNVAILIYILLQGGTIYSLWIGWKNHFVALRTLLASSLIILAYFSWNSGRLWLASDIINAGAVHSISLKDDKCIDRIALRSNSTGYLLYSLDLKQFEFRSKDDIKTIFAKKGCV